MSASQDILGAFPPHVEEFVFQHLSMTELLIASTVRGSWNNFVGQRPQTKGLRLRLRSRIFDSDLNLLRQHSRAYQNIALDYATFTAAQLIRFVDTIEPCIVDFYLSDLLCSDGPYQIPPEWTFPHLRRLAYVDDWGTDLNPVHALGCFRHCTGLEMLLNLYCLSDLNASTNYHKPKTSCKIFLLHFSSVSCKIIRLSFFAWRILVLQSAGRSDNEDWERQEERFAITSSRLALTFQILCI